MPECYRCLCRPAMPGDGLCEECARNHPHMGSTVRGAISLGKSYDEFYRQILIGKPNFEGLLIADDVLLQYEYYKYDHRFLPLLGAGSGSYRDEHKKLEDYFFDHFLSIFKERILAIDGMMVNEALYGGIKDDFFNFHSSIIQYLLDIGQITQDTTIPYIGNALSFQVQLLLKKELVRIGIDPAPIDIAAREFDPGSALFFLELYVLLKEKDAIHRLQQIFSLTPHIRRSIIQQPVVLLIPWDHQKQAFESWLKNEKNGIVEMATATGKTLVGLMAIEALYQVKPHSVVRIFAHSTNILNQWRREVVDKLGIIDNSRSSYLSPIKINGFSIHFNTLQTVYKNPQEYPADLLIADEVHHLAAPEFRKALTIPCTWKLGLSATVEGEQRSVILKEELGAIVYRFTLNEALERGVLPSFQWIICPVYLSVEENKEFSEITNTIRKKFQAIKNDKKTILELSQGKFAVLNDLNDFIRLMEFARYNKLEVPEEWKILVGLILKRRWIIHRSHPRLQEAMKLIRDVAHDQKAIVFAMDIRSCDIIAENLKKDVKNLYLVHSKVKEDVFTQISSFRKGNNGVLIGARMLDEGIDIPDASIGINVASSKTRLQLIQRLGRILRQQKGKKPVFYHYVAIPEREDLIEEEDHLTFLDDLAWVQDTALKLGLNTEVRFSDDAIRGISKDAEQTLSKKYYASDKIAASRIGTFNPDYILKQFSPASIEIIIKELLKLGKNCVVSDKEWSRIVKFANGKKETDSYQLPGFWWLLVLANRNPHHLIRLFEPNFEFTIVSQKQSGEEYQINQLKEPVVPLELGKKTPDKVKKVIPREEVIEVVPPEGVIEVVPPEGVIEVVPPEGVIEVVTPEEVIDVVTPEEVIEIVPPEEVMKTTPLEETLIQIVRTEDKPTALTLSEIEDLTKEAENLFIKKDLKNARVLCEILLTTGHKSVKVLNIAAACSFLSGDIQQAESHLKEAIGIDSKVPFIWENLSNIYRKLGFDEKAVQCEHIGKKLREK